MAYAFVPVGILVGVLFVLAAVVSDDLNLWQRPLVGIGGLLTGIASTTVVLRFGRLGIYVDHQGVCVRRLTKTMRFPDAQVASFSLEQWQGPMGRAIPAVAINLTSGDRIVLWELNQWSAAVLGGTSVPEIVTRLTEAQCR